LIKNLFPTDTIYFTALSADGKTVAWGGAEEKDKKVTGTAHVWEVGSLATSAPELPMEPKKIEPAGANKAVKDKKPEAVVDPWAPLFNGKDLTGWFMEGGDPAAWQVERDELLVDSAKGARRYNFLLTKKTYSAFLLRFECQLSKEANTGVALWATPNEKVYREGPVHLMVKLLDDPSYPNIGWPTGTLFWNLDGGGHLLPPDWRAKLKPVGSWNQVEVEARAQSLRVSVNGLEVLSVRPDKLGDEPGAFAGLKRCSGHIGFEKGSAGVARFRKIEIKELKPATGPQEINPKPNLKEAASKATTKAGGTDVKELRPDWAPLSGGKDLAGFEGLPGAWRLEDGVLQGTRPAAPTTHATFLSSQKQFRDFELIFRVKLEGGQGGSGVILRGKPGSRFLPTSPLVKIGEGWGGWGHLTWEQNGTPLIKMSKDMQEAVRKVVKKDGFNDYYIKCVGKQILIQVNGFTTVDQTWDPLPDEGILAFQIHYGRDTKAVEFRDIQIKELQAATVPHKGYLGLVSVRPALHGEPYIDEIAAGSPAEKAGLKRGETIVGLNDAKIHDIKQLGAAFDKLRLKPGERIAIRIVSADGKERSVTLTASERPKSEEGKTLPTESKTAPKIIHDEMKKLAGVWHVVSFKDNGNDMPADAVNDLKVVITGDKYLARLEGKDALAWTYKLDPTKKPKTLDITFLTGRKQGQTAPGIYSLEGDTFTICGAEPGQERPTEFAAKPGSKHCLMAHKRKTAKTPAVGDAKGVGPPLERKQPELNKPIRK
jgi:uncharacterized protein (TIGR03067 family)